MFERIGLKYYDSLLLIEGRIEGILEPICLIAETTNDFCLCYKFSLQSFESFLHKIPFKIILDLACIHKSLAIDVYGTNFSRCQGAFIFKEISSFCLVFCNRNGNTISIV